MDKEKTIRIRISPEEVFRTLLEPKGVMIEKPFFVMDPFCDDWEKDGVSNDLVDNGATVVTKDYKLLDTETSEWEFSSLFFTRISYWYSKLPDRETAYEMSVPEDGNDILINVRPCEIYNKLLEPKGIKKNVKYNFYHPDGSEWGFNPSYLNEDFELVDSSGTANDDLSLLFEADLEPIG